MNIIGEPIDELGPIETKKPGSELPQGAKTMAAWEVGHTQNQYQDRTLEFICCVSAASKCLDCALQPGEPIWWQLYHCRQSESKQPMKRLEWSMCFWSLDSVALPGLLCRVYHAVNDVGQAKLL